MAAAATATTDPAASAGHDPFGLWEGTRKDVRDLSYPKSPRRDGARRTERVARLQPARTSPG
jgi:hypothetical protein